MGHNPEIESRLVQIDADFSIAEMPLADRPFNATLLFARGFVLEVSDGKGGSTTPPEDVVDLVRAPWFAQLFKIVHHWYAERYGESNLSHDTNYLPGFVNIRGAPFAIHVPAVTTRVEEEGRTAWMTFPVGVEDDELPLGWIKASPDLSRFPEADIEQIRREVVDQASELRQVNSSLTGIKSTDDALHGLLATTRKAIEDAAEIGGTSLDGDALSHGYWHLQMACECALKAVRQAKEGTFQPIHELGQLYDAVAKYGMPYERATLGALPHWKTIVELRYRQGEPRTREAYLKAFRLTLAIVAQTLEAIVSTRLAGAGFLLARPPWFASIDKGTDSS